MNYDTIKPYIEKKLVAEQTHPLYENLRIFNYTQVCQFERSWDEVTRQCRGFILDMNTGNIVANPFPKFFNYDEWIVMNGVIPTSEPTVYEKYDGSLGILYWWNDEPWIATRGSFDSEQARWAIRYFREHCDVSQYDRTKTYLFEIIYPENRIVVQYDYQGLVLLAIRDIETGKETSVAGSNLTGVRTAKGVQEPLESLKTHIRDNFEGYVIHWEEEGIRLKIKLSEYVRLHRIITGVSKIAIWEYLKESKDLGELLKKVPDEFFKWVRQTEKELRELYDSIWVEADTVVAEAMLKSFDRKERASHIVSHSRYPGVCFAMLDDKDYKSLIWKLIRPKGERPFRIDEV